MNRLEYFVAMWCALICSVAAEADMTKWAFLTISIFNGIGYYKAVINRQKDDE